MLISPLGDSAALIRLGDGVDEAMSARVRALAQELERDPLNGMCDVAPAFSSVAVFFQRPCADVAALEEEVAVRLARVASDVASTPSGTRDIPVCYGGEFGPDLEEVARQAGMSADEVVAAHHGAEYVVHAIGFLPGFPYLGGLPPQLATPRRRTPRPEVPAGSVGIGGAQTGVYPIASPGGWNLIGQTPLKLFEASRERPTLLAAGDRVRFLPVAAAQFKRMAEGSAESSRLGREAGGEELAGAPNAITIRRAGMLTTVQDLGRSGHRREGVPLSGAVDPFALRLANMLVGNADHAAGLEFTLVGPEIEFRAGALVAVGGGDFGFPRWRPFWVGAGETLRLGAARSGCRGYLAIGGGIEVRPVLGSRSTYVRAGLGGSAGRALKDGDVLPIPQVTRRVLGRWRIDPRILPEYSAAPEVRVTTGIHAGEFSASWEAEKFEVTPQSDRMGIRLRGGEVVRTEGGELTSIPLAPGTMQVPPDGHPIIVLADAQTIGGYPQLAHVAAVDLPLLGQLRPGHSLRFRRVTLQEAYELWSGRERALGMLREGLAQKLA